MCSAAEDIEEERVSSSWGWVEKAMPLLPCSHRLLALGCHEDTSYKVCYLGKRSPGPGKPADETGALLTLGHCVAQSKMVVLGPPVCRTCFVASGT